MALYTDFILEVDNLVRLCTIGRR